MLIHGQYNYFGDTGMNTMNTKLSREFYNKPPRVKGMYNQEGRVDAPRSNVPTSALPPKPINKDYNRILKNQSMPQKRLPYDKSKTPLNMILALSILEENKQITKEGTLYTCSRDSLSGDFFLNWSTSWRFE